MKKYFVLSIVFFCFLVSSLAQNKLFNLDEQVPYPRPLSGLQWKGKSNQYVYIDNNTLMVATTPDGVASSLLALSDLNAALGAQKIKTLKRFPSLEWLNDDVFTFIQDTFLLSYSLSKKELKLLNSWPSEASGQERAPITNYIAYTLENNLFVGINGKQTAVTQDTDKGIVNGQTVHRNEFGISDGIFWSPKGNLLAFYRKDERMVTEYPLVNIDTRIATVENSRYPMAGMTSEEVTVGVYNPATGKTIFLNTGEPRDQYLTNITWSPDESKIYIFVLNRAQNHVKLNCYDATTGNYIFTLFEDKNDRYVEPLKGLEFVPEKPQQFICQSQRDGYNHLYLYDVSGKLIRQLTKGPWVVTEFLGFDKSGKIAFFMSTQASPIENQAYSVELMTGKISRITQEPGTHSVQISNDGKFVLDEYSSLTIAWETHLLSTTGKTLKIIQENKDPWKDYKLGKTTVFTLKADDGSDLYCRLIKPIDFDSTKKYPVLIYVYGGPHNQLVTNSWTAGAGMWLNYMAQKGYVVFTLDNRGTVNRGFAFESCIHRNLGLKEVADQMQGVNYLKSLPWVDANRIGVNGWSYGGFMTISLMLKNPGVFKVAVAGGPVIDWKLYEVMYGERYMDTPEENPEGYKNACLLNYTDNLKGKLLIIHGTMDATVVWQHSLQFLKKCIESKKQVDYFVYPGHEHNVRGVDRIHMWKKITEYFDQNL